MRDQEKHDRIGWWFGWALAGTYFAHQALTTNLARTDRFSDARDDLRNWHYAVGTVLLALAIRQVLTWRRDRPVQPPLGSHALRHWVRLLALTTLCLLVAAPVLGLLVAWGDGLPVFGLPSAFGPDRNLWMFAGYFHSSMGFTLMILNLAGLLSACYAVLRHGRAALADFPAGYGLFVLLGTTTVVYAFTTFSSPEPGVPAVLIFWTALLGIWALAWGLDAWRGRWMSRGVVTAGPSGASRVATAAAALVLVGAGAYAPHALFRVTPWPMGEAIAGPAGATSHAGPAMQVALSVETPFEREVRTKTYKWCRFCHTVEKGGEHLVGPNLHAIFGQRAGTVPNFHYSEAMVGARRRGLVWNDETIAAYIAGPDRFLPGTRMIISSGPVTDPAVRAAIVNILKRDTMTPAP